MSIISAHYPRVPLGEIARSISRPLPVEPGKAYRTLGVKWWGEGAYERQTIDGAATAAKVLSLVRENDLIINKIWVRHGSTAIVGAAVDGCAASGEFPTFELDRARVLPAWLHWQTKTPGFWAKCDALSQGTSGKNRIKPDLFLTIEVPLPPLAEQRRVVARIEALAAKIAEARRLRAEASETDLQNMLLSVYNSIIQDVPRTTLAELAPMTRRPVDIKVEQEYHELGVRSFGKGTFHKPPLQGAEVGTKRLFRLEPGDLLFNNVFAWEGAIAVVRPENKGRVGSHRFIACVAQPGLATASFLCFHFLTKEGLQTISDASPGGAGRNRTLGLEALAQIFVPVPAYEDQVWFAALTAKVDALRALQGETATALAALLPAVLDRAFRGEL